MTMAVKVRKKAAPSPFRPAEVNGEDSSTGLENPSYLPGAFLACFAGQMMKHHCGQYGIELCRGKRQGLGSSPPEDNFDARSSGLLIGSCEHLGRSIDPAHCTH